MFCWAVFFTQRRKEEKSSQSPEWPIGKKHIIPLFILFCVETIIISKVKPPNEAADQVGPKATALPCYGIDCDIFVGICNTDSLFAYLVFFATLREIKNFNFAILLQICVAFL